MKSRSRINKKIVFWVLGIIFVAALAGAMFFVSYYEVEKVEVRGNTRYTEEEVQKMALTGPFARNSVLAPLFCTKEKVSDVYFVEGWSVTPLSRNSIVVNLREKKPVGCISYLDSFIYFDRSGIFVDASRTREEKIPFFSGIEVDNVVQEEKLPIRGSTILSTAVTLSSIFQKEEDPPDFVRFDEKNQVRLTYGDITVNLGKNEHLEDKMARVTAILPKITGRKGTLHLESVTESNKTVTFEADAEENYVDPEQAAAWNGGFDEYGDYTGYGEYDGDGHYVGPKPMTDQEYAIAHWAGGYDGEGDFTGSGEFDANGNPAGEKPTEETLQALGDWKGGYNEAGDFTWTGEYDRDGNYVGPNPNASGENEENPEEGTGDEAGGMEENSADAPETGTGEEASSGEGSGSQEDGGMYDEAYYDSLYEGIYW